MPSVMDAPELVAYVETHALTRERIEYSQPRRARPGFWRMLAHTITRYLIPMSRAREIRDRIADQANQLVEHFYSLGAYLSASNFPGAAYVTRGLYAVVQRISHV